MSSSTSKQSASLELQKKIFTLVKQTKKASVEAAQIPSNLKNKVLAEVAKQLEKQKDFLIRENQKDLQFAKSLGLSSAMMDRLTLNPQRITTMAEGVKTVIDLKDPIGVVQSSWKRPNGIKISKITVPLGVILIIYEARPNVTVDCAALCLKSSNAVILRGGKEAFYSNQALVKIFQEALKKYRLSPEIVEFVRTTEYEAVDLLLGCEKEINLVIPRGGEALIRKVVQHSRIPVVKHYQGICHVYVDQSADLKKAEAIILNAKLQRPGVCNAMETLLVHQSVAGKLLPALGKKLHDKACEVRASSEAKKWMPHAKLAQSNDFGREFLDKILAVKTVKSLEEAIEHIQQYGSGHTDAIVSSNKKSTETFKRLIDSASVMVNASTRFSDGFEFGFGAEIGISTDKIHARGPMGLEGLTSYKYVVEGNGQIRS